MTVDLLHVLVVTKRWFYAATGEAFYMAWNFWNYLPAWDYLREICRRVFTCFWRWSKSLTATSRMETKAKNQYMDYSQHGIKNPSVLCMCRRRKRGAMRKSSGLSVQLNLK